VFNYICNIINYKYIPKMQDVLFIKPYWPGTGFTNQLFFIVSSIIYAYEHNQHIVIYDDFLTEIMTNRTCPQHQIIDFGHLNNIIKKYGIYATDKHQVKLTIDNVEYGTQNIKINITKEIMAKYYRHNFLHIDKGIDLNAFKGDPAPGQAKKLYIKYHINHIEYNTEYDECGGLQEAIHFDLIYSTNFHNWDELYIDGMNPIMFNYLLSNLKFCDRYYQMATNALASSNIDYAKPIHVIHMRLESDMSKHGGNCHAVTPAVFIQMLEQKYIKLIKKYVHVDDNILLLSYNTDNMVIDFLRENQYNYFIGKKEPGMGREVNALVDLLIGEKCTGCFIGNWNVKKLIGSTFSYTLFIRLGVDIKKVVIDIEKLGEDEFVFGL